MQGRNVWHLLCHLRAMLHEAPATPCIQLWPKCRILVHLPSCAPLPHAGCTFCVGCCMQCLNISEKRFKRFSSGIEHGVTCSPDSRLHFTMVGQSVASLLGHALSHSISHCYQPPVLTSPFDVQLHTSASGATPAAKVRQTPCVHVEYFTAVFFAFGCFLSSAGHTWQLSHLTLCTQSVCLTRCCHV